MLSTKRYRHGHRRRRELL